MSTDRVAKEEGDKGEDPSSPSALRFRTTHEEYVTVLEVRGDLEDEHKAAFRDALLQTIGDGDSTNDPKAATGSPRDIAVDLRDVPFLSEESLAVLIHVLKLQRARGAALRLIRPSPFIRRKLRRTTLGAFFPLDED